MSVSNTLHGSASFDPARFSTASIVILPVTSTIQATETAGAIRFTPQSTLPRQIIATPPITYNHQQPPTLAHLMVDRRHREPCVPNRSVSILMGSRPASSFVPSSQQVPLMQTSSNNNFSTVMGPTNVKEEPSPAYNSGTRSQEIYLPNNEEQTDHDQPPQLHRNLEEEEPEAEPPTGVIAMPINMTQPKIVSSTISQLPSIQIKPEIQNQFVNNVNPEGTNEDSSLNAAQSIVGRNKSEIISSRTILGGL